MKTDGICNTKSARKHRKMGHATLRLSNGKYVWTSLTSAIETVDTRNGGIIVGYSRERARREGKRVDMPFVNGKKPIGVIIDEEFPPPTINRLLKDTNGMMAGSLTSDLGEDYKKLLNESERHIRKKSPLTVYDIEIGAFYMPRKCNAASKPYEVLRASYAEEFVIIRKQGDQREEHMPLPDFLSFVSRRVWP